MDLRLAGQSGIPASTPSVSAAFPEFPGRSNLLGSTPLSTPDCPAAPAYGAVLRAPRLDRSIDVGWFMAGLVPAARRSRHHQRQGRSRASDQQHTRLLTRPQNLLTRPQLDLGGRLSAANSTPGCPSLATNHGTLHHARMCAIVAADPVKSPHGRAADTPCFGRVRRDVAMLLDP